MDKSAKGELPITLDIIGYEQTQEREQIVSYAKQKDFDKTKQTRKYPQLLIRIFLLLICEDLVNVEHIFVLHKVKIIKSIQV